MKSIISAVVVSGIVAAAFVYYDVKPKIEKRDAEIQALRAQFERIRYKTDYAYEELHKLQGDVQGVKERLSDPRCVSANLKIDLVNGTVGGVSVDADVNKILKELRPCIEKDDDWINSKLKELVANNKLWIIPIKAAAADFFFFGEPDGRRHIDIPSRRTNQEVVNEGVALNRYRWSDENLEKILGKAVARSKNDVSSEEVKYDESGYSSYTTTFHVRLYEAKYGCVVVRYLSLGKENIIQKAQEISMSTGKCAALDGKLDARVVSGFPLESM